MCIASREPTNREYPHRIEIMTARTQQASSPLTDSRDAGVVSGGSRSCWPQSAVPLDSRVYFDQTATRVVMVVAILSTDHLLSARGIMVKQLGLDRVHVVQKPLALSFHVPLSFVPDSSIGSRVTLPSGIKVILNLVPDGEVAVNGSPLKKVL
jgi:hypothetical protein